jgi:HSP20 family molecular chaperone IbpA
MFIIQHRQSPTYYNPLISGGCARPSFYLIPHHKRSAPREATKEPTKEGEVEESTSETERVIYRDPNTRAYETKDSFRFVYDLPGVKEEDVEVTLDGNVLSLKAARKNGNAVIRKHDEKFVIHRANVDVTEVVSTLEDGVLTVTVSKCEEMKPFQVQVVASDPPARDDEKIGLLLTIDVPGVKASDASVEYKNGFLSVQCKRSNKETVRKYAVNQSKVDLNKVEAFLIDGVLTITAPARPAKRVKLMSRTDKIEVAHATSTQSQEHETTSKSDSATAENDDVKEYEIVVETANDE